jgi:hypothetical protein
MRSPADVVRGEQAGRDAGADDGRDQKRGPDELGRDLVSEAHEAVSEMSVASADMAVGLDR